MRWIDKGPGRGRRSLGRIPFVPPAWLYGPSLAVLATPVAGLADDTDPIRAEDLQARYRDCLITVQVRAPEALELALAWGQESPELFYPRHCIAMALFAIGDYDRAARGLNRLAEETGGPTAGKLQRQAGEAWLQAGQPAAAIAAFRAALAEEPEDPRLLIDLARAHAEAEQFWAALDLLDRALEADPEDPDAHVFRANAYRRLDVWDLALADVERALMVAPHHIDALVERGIIRLHHGDIAGARADFGEALIHGPETPGAELARAYLDEIDRQDR